MAEILDPKSPTRKDLARFLPDQRAVLAFEELFKLVPSQFNVVDQLVQDNSALIATNTTNIATNAALITTNTTSIATNAALAHAQNSDTFLDQGGANEVTAANAADAVTKKHDPGSGHNVIIKAAAQTDVPAPTAVNPPAGGTGTTAGAYDTAANRDLMIASLTSAVADIAAMKVVVDGLLAKLRTSNSVAI